MDSSKRTKRIRLIVFTALMTALTTALTLASVPLASGYYNFGDIPIFMSACLLGPIPALITGALGAMLGDVILGYMAYAPFTLVIKALEGLIAGLLFKIISKTVKNQVPQSIFYCLGSIVGGLEMALGYFLAEGLLLAEDSWTGGVVNLPFNILQGTISAVVATVLLYACQLKRIFQKIYNRTPQVASPAALDDTTTQNTSSEIESTQERAQKDITSENNDELR
ncbi:MAG: ECF transporter S component [Clostridia bacterium]|nr:ECF transporter S component [Clostridia bacterium]